MSGLPNNIAMRQLERKILVDGSELTDIHMNVFQVLLKVKFPHVKGLSSTLAPSSVGGWIENYVQILHCNGNHWITVSTIGCANDMMNVYDSLYRNITEETKTKDCGLFAVAFASYLAHGNDPSLLPHCQFHQSSLRTMLLNMFEQKSVFNFPYTICYTP